jgi:hypothetical protein
MIALQQEYFDQTGRTAINILGNRGEYEIGYVRWLEKCLDKYHSEVIKISNDNLCFCGNKATRHKCEECHKKDIEYQKVPF